jgi:hypothetical protein
MRTGRVPLFDKPNKQYVAKSASYATFFSVQTVFYLCRRFYSGKQFVLLRIKKLCSLFTIK